MNLATIAILAIVALAVGFAIKSVVSGHGCDSCKGGSCGGCSGNCGGCNGRDSAEKMPCSIDASDSESSGKLTRTECECAGGRWS